MNLEQEKLIPLDVPKSDFERFLAHERNKRIFFSGKFGIGKSFFLQHFFEANKDTYDAYHLYPARYQISSTENIIELLKYDILVEFLKLHPDVFEGKEPKGIKESFKLFAAFCKDKGSINGFLKTSIETGEGLLALSPDPFFQVLGKLGRPLNDLLAIDKDFQEFKKKHLSGQKEAIEKFLKEIATEVDSIATDYVSQFLRTKIEESKGDKKRSVLVLDDFDRIDPEHIFRILNVLSAHMENEEDNKFGFDHIVIVGDINNIESVFHHRYGESAEFWGYFDKFFTVKPFYFDNSKAISERIPSLLQQIQHEDPNFKDALGDGGIITSLLVEVLRRAFAIEEMNLRQLYKPIHHAFPEMRKGSYGGRDPFSDGRNKLIDICIKLLVAIYGGKGNFLRVLKKIKENVSSSDTNREWFYANYSSSMLRRMVPIKAGEQAHWLGDKYLLLAVQDPSHSGRVDIVLGSDKKANPVYFYDVLIEYVKQTRYEKTNRDEYEFM